MTAICPIGCSQEKKQVVVDAMTSQQNLAMQHATVALQKEIARLNEKLTSLQNPNSPALATPPEPASASVVSQVNSFTRAVFTPQTSARINRPVAEIRDDILGIRKRIQQTQVSLALEVENARNDNSDPRRNIVRRASIVRFNNGVNSLNIEHDKLMTELQNALPSPPPPPAM